MCSYAILIDFNNLRYNNNVQAKKYCAMNTVSYHIIMYDIIAVLEFRQSNEGDTDIQQAGKMKLLLVVVPYPGTRVLYGIVPILVLAATKVTCRKLSDGDDKELRVKEEEEKEGKGRRRRRRRSNKSLQRQKNAQEKSQHTTVWYVVQYYVRARRRRCTVK